MPKKEFIAPCLRQSGEELSTGPRGVGLGPVWPTEGFLKTEDSGEGVRFPIGAGAPAFETLRQWRRGANT